jgi:hypothetical protein
MGTDVKMIGQGRIKKSDQLEELLTLGRLRWFSFKMKVTYIILIILHPSHHLLGYDTVQWCGRIQTFWRVMLPPSSG